MPIDWLVVWGVTKGLSFVFKPVLEDLAKDISKDLAKDYVKGCFGSVFSSLRKDPLHKALGRALKELLQLMQEELLDADLQPDALAGWIPDVKTFTRSEGTQQAVRHAFTVSDSPVDPALFAKSWMALPYAHKLPENFSWDRIAKRFSRKVRELREDRTCNA